jgi:hypothetical protein
MLQNYLCANVQNRQLIREAQAIRIVLSDVVSSFSKQVVSMLTILYIVPGMATVLVPEGCHSEFSLREILCLAPS